MTAFDSSKIKLSRLPDPKDARDFSIRKLIFRDVPLPSRYLINEGGLIYNQESLPACVAFAGAGVKTDQEYLEFKDEIEFDGKWLYNECKKIDGIPDVEGTYIRYALQVMMTSMKEKDSTPICRFLKSEKKPNPKWKIKGYYRIGNEESIDYIKQVIFQYGSIYVGSVWAENWMSGIWNGGYVIPEPIYKEDGSDGGHAYRITGWEDKNTNAFQLTNSWGKIWGKEGRVWLPYTIFEKVKAIDTTDIWKVVDEV